MDRSQNDNLSFDFHKPMAPSSISRDLNLPKYDPDYRDLPEYVWNRPSYDEEKRQLLADGWEEAEVDHAVKERNHFRENRKYYSKNFATLRLKSQIYNEKRAHQLHNAAPDVKAAAKDRHRKSQEKYRIKNREKLAFKERERREVQRAWRVLNSELNTEGASGVIEEE
ncbi:hypothetical protein C8R41DRAFT_870181 [Lentinula lateritia]|uniref:BZIP domain-containing protein n=1 Tax=Lentinula lateritia TaxID=40482 RepID=A0ABQ8V4G4_9AGAR|nr:hypothetical protein C8R41DRAFT_870181 [Lentinula lateritia]